MDAGQRSYIPHGPTDPNAVLLTFTLESGEYWDAPSNPVPIAIEFIRASVVGDKPALGDNAEVPMQSLSLSAELRKHQRVGDIGRYREEQASAIAPVTPIKVPASQIENGRKQGTFTLPGRFTRAGL